MRLGNPPRQQSVRVVTETLEVLCQTKLELCIAGMGARSAGVCALALVLDDVHDGLKRGGLSTRRGEIEHVLRTARVETGADSDR